MTQTPLFFKDGIFLGNTKDISHSDKQAEKCGLSLANALKKVKNIENIADVKIGIMYNELKEETKHTARKLLGGINLSGAQSYNLGGGFPELCAFICLTTIYDICGYVDCDDGGNHFVSLLNPCAFSASKSFEREYEKIMSGKVQTAKEKSEFENEAPFCETQNLSGISHFYTGHLANRCKELCGKDGLYGLKVTIDAQKYTHIGGVKPFLEALYHLGADINSINTEKAKELSNFSTEIILSENEPGIVLKADDAQADFTHMNAIILNAISKTQNSFILPYLSPEIYRKIARVGGVEIRDYGNYPEEPAVFSQTEALNDAFLKDRFMSAILVLSLMKKRGMSLKELLTTIPEFFIYSMEITENQTRKRHRVMSGFAAKYVNEVPDNNKHEAIRLAFSSGRVTVIPNRAGTYRLVSEAQNSEMAKELCYQAKNMLDGAE